MKEQNKSQVPPVTITDQQQLRAEKRKCRGNRKLQRHRRRLRETNCDAATVSNLQQMAATRQNDVTHNEMEIQVSTTATLNQVHHVYLNSEICMR